MGNETTGDHGDHPAMQFYYHRDTSGRVRSITVQSGDYVADVFLTRVVDALLSQSYLFAIVSVEDDGIGKGSVATLHGNLELTPVLRAAMENEEGDGGGYYA